MPESLQPNNLRAASSVNPFEVGGKSSQSELKVRSSLAETLRKKFGREKMELSKAEVADLLTIDPGNVTLEKVKAYLATYLWNEEKDGPLRRTPYSERRYQRARAVRIHLEKNDYEWVAAFYLQRAKEEWRPKYRESEAEEHTVRFFSMQEVVGVPQEVIFQGDTAIQNWHREHGSGKILSFALESSSMYLKQAAVLARVMKAEQK